MMETSETFDVVIIGAGSAGCALAEGLSADAKLSVLVLEAGGGDRRFWIKTPIGYGMNFYNPRVNWRFWTAPDPGLGGRADYWPRGKALGGSSSINAMVYCRGLPADYDDWRDAGNPGWGWADVEPVYNALEARDAAPRRPALTVSHRDVEHHRVRDYFFEAAEAIGLRQIGDLNGSEDEGVGSYAITTRGGLRWSSADAFLRPAMRRRNVTVRTRAHTTKIVIEEGRAVGVLYRRRGVEHRVNARASVVLSAGAVGSPQMMQLSGVGPGALLAEHGVRAVRANDSVGGSLQDHLGIDYLHRATAPTLNQILGTWRGSFIAGAQFVLTRRGPLSLSINQSGGFARSRPDAPRPDVQLYFNPLSYSVKLENKRYMMRPDTHPGFALGFNTCRPTSRGRIDIASSDPFAAPLIRANYLSTDEDVANVISGARLLGRLQETEAMRTLIDGPPPLRLSEASDEEILTDFRARSGSVYHACGTCRMAPERDGGVVDPRLRVYGVDGLRVVDASIFPNVTSANTNAPSIMVGRRAAQLMREDLALG